MSIFRETVLLFSFDSSSTSFESTSISYVASSAFFTRSKPMMYSTRSSGKSSGCFGDVYVCAGLVGSFAANCQSSPVFFVPSLRISNLIAPRLFVGRSFGISFRSVKAPVFLSTSPIAMTRIVRSDFPFGSETGPVTTEIVCVVGVPGIRGVVGVLEGVDVLAVPFGIEAVPVDVAVSKRSS